MATMLNTSRASYQRHNVQKGKSAPTEKTVKMLQFTDSDDSSSVQYKPIEEKYIHAVARGCPSMNPMEVACALMSGNPVMSDWTRINDGKVYLVRVVTIKMK